MSLITALQQPHTLPPEIKEVLDQLIVAIQRYEEKGVLDHRSYITAKQPHAVYCLGAAQEITNAASTYVTWDADNKQNYPDTTVLSGYRQHDNGADFGGEFLVADGTTLLPPVGGVYLVIFSVGFEANATGVRYAWIERTSGNTGTIAALVNQTAVTATLARLQVSAILTFPAAPQITKQGIRCAVYQTSGGGLDITATADQRETQVQIIKLS